MPIRQVTNLSSAFVRPLHIPTLAPLQPSGPKIFKYFHDPNAIISVDVKTKNNTQHLKVRLNLNLFEFEERAKKQTFLLQHALPSEHVHKKT